jgi:CO dehydrogenase maturation factor
VTAAGLRLAVAGKGGAGKSTVAATLARLLARKGHDVLALDSDMQPGLSYGLGVLEIDEPPLNQAAERGEDGRWRLRRGIGPVRAIERFSIAAPDGVRLLQAGKATPDGLKAVMASVNAFYAVIHRLDGARSLAQWAIVGDLPAGPRQLAYDWAPYARDIVVIVEPTWQSILTARRILGLGWPDRDVRAHLVVNKCREQEDLLWVQERLDRKVETSIPLDRAVVAADAAGAALLDHSPRAEAVRGIEALAERLTTTTVTP